MLLTCDSSWVSICERECLVLWHLASFYPEMEDQEDESELMYIFSFSGLTFRDVCVMVVRTTQSEIVCTHSDIESPPKEMSNKRSTKIRGPMTKDVYENI